ncbi:MAG: class I SAM-dependent methyltransferase [Solirubrobacterales bacterium]|nr:class I SAM-dependent methyltransferase [Solirubrobacterales bacterium]
MEHAAGHLREVNHAFERQSGSFATSAVANSDELRQALLDVAQPAGSERWLDAACGPGIVTRALATRAARVIGVDATEAMVQRARDAASSAGLDNVSFEVGDATNTGHPTASFDGAVTRFAIHHIPVPGRLFGELARVVRPGGRVVVLDHLADEDAEARSWVQEVERLRDPSHWASLSPEMMRRLAEQAGLTMVEERCFSFELDFDDWLARGTDDPKAVAMVDHALTVRPAGTDRFAVLAKPEGRVLRLAMWLGSWSR